MNKPEPPDEPDDLPEDHVSFVGPCECDHEPGQHGWTGCDVPGCPCSAAWEE